MTEKEKQIEEMAKIVCNVSEFGCGISGDCDLDRDVTDCRVVAETAEKLYEVGYRKQVEGEWIRRVEYNSIEDRDDEYYQCPVCGLCMSCSPRFCCGCGAKMKGGESDA